MKSMLKLIVKIIDRITGNDFNDRFPPEIIF